MISTTSHSTKDSNLTWIMTTWLNDLSHTLKLELIWLIQWSNWMTKNKVLLFSFFKISRTYILNLLLIVFDMKHKFSKIILYTEHFVRIRKILEIDCVGYKMYRYTKESCVTTIGYVYKVFWHGRIFISRIYLQHYLTCKTLLY